MLGNCAVAVYDETSSVFASVCLPLTVSSTLSGSISLVGEPWLCAGAVVTLQGFGSFDGNFFIEKATHTMSSGGYVTNIDVRRVNNKY